MDPLSTSDTDKAVKYINSIVYTDVAPYATVLISIYNNGYLTSIGLVPIIYVDSEPKNTETFGAPIIYNQDSILYLPSNFIGRQCICSDDIDMLIEGHQSIYDAMTFDDITKYSRELTGVDYDNELYIVSGGLKYKNILLL